MTHTSNNVAMERARDELFWKRAKIAILLGGIIYPAFAVFDYQTFGAAKWIPALWIRMASTATALAIFALSVTPWGKRRRTFLFTAVVFVVHLGSQAIICYEDAYGSPYEAYDDTIELLFAGYCVLMPVRTLYAFYVGLGMVAASLGIEAIFKHRIPKELDYTSLYDFLVISVYLVGRYFANSLWESDFKAKAALHKANEELEKAHLDLQLVQERMVQAERMAAIGKLTAEVAHELNTPLTTIAMSISPIERETFAHPDTPEPVRQAVTENLALVRHGVDQAKTLIRNLRKFGTLVRKEAALNDVNAILQTSISMIAEQAHRKAVSIHPEYGDTAKTWCNAQGLSQVFLNVLNNAYQAVGRSGNIWIQSSRESGMIIVSFLDDGGGVPEGYATRVFEPNFSTKEGSTGLGLTISKRIIEEHGGTIQIVNRTPGAEVKIGIPIRDH